MTSPDAWMNGQFIAYQQMAVPVWDLGVVAGASITEMARTYQHKPFRFDQHLDRLLASCKELEFAVPFGRSELLQAANEVCNRNVQRIATTADLGIVMFVTAGANRTYLGGQPLPPPTVGIHSFELPFDLWKGAAADGIRLVTPQIRQHHQRDLPVHRKVRNRLHWWLADRQADKEKSGTRALLLDCDDRITETSTSAFYAVIDGTIVTPAENVLESLSRKMVSEAADEAGIPFCQKDIHLNDLRAASECFASSTPVGILPVAAVNAMTFPVLSSPSIVPTLLGYWKQQTGINPRQQILGD